MTIADGVLYNTNEEKVDEKNFVQFYRSKPTIHVKKKVGVIIRKMFKTENNIVRTRRINESWTQPSPNEKRRTSVFKIGELHKDHQVPLSLEPYGPPKYSIKKSKMDYAKNMMKIILHHVENYFDKSSLHGLRYVGDTSLSLGERIFWFIAFVSSFAFATYYITNIFDKWKSNPVLVAFSPTDATLNDIPFPAITICNMNQAKKVEAERILKDGTLIEKQLLTDYCNYNNNTFDGDKKAPDWNVVQNFLIKVGQTCADTLKSCMWQNEKISCDEYFNNDLTDEGLCCSFNRLPPENIFRNPNDFASLNHTYPKKIFDWSPEKGFPSPNTGDINVIPIRPSGSGTHLGLSVAIDAQTHNYFCSSTNSIGFKIMLSNPIETPKIADYGFLVSPGVEARYTIKPEIKEATQKVRDVSITKRQCYFQDERPLRYFRSYTKRNCRLECQSNHTLTKCQCIPYYLPKSKSVKVCGKRDERCIVEAKEDMELVYGNGSSCMCLPSCFEMSYDKSATYSNLLKMSKQYEMEDITDEYFRKNMAVLHFFFKETKFRKQVKSEIFGFTEVLSNVGGLLGLCLGFSILSLIELFYYLTLKLICGYIQSRMKQGQKKKKENSGRFSSTVIPFIK